MPAKVSDARRRPAAGVSGGQQERRKPRIGLQDAIGKRGRGAPRKMSMHDLRRALFLYLTDAVLTKKAAAARAAAEAFAGGRRKDCPYQTEEALKRALGEQLEDAGLELAISVAAEAGRQGCRTRLHHTLERHFTANDRARFDEDRAISHFSAALEGRVSGDVWYSAVQDAYDELVETLNRAPRRMPTPHAPTLAAPLPARTLQAVEDGSAGHLLAALRDRVDPDLSLDAVLAAFDEVVARLNARFSEVKEV